MHVVNIVLVFYARSLLHTNRVWNATKQVMVHCACVLCTKTYLINIFNRVQTRAGQNARRPSVAVCRVKQIPFRILNQITVARISHCDVVRSTAICLLPPVANARNAHTAGGGQRSSGRQLCVRRADRIWTAECVCLVAVQSVAEGCVRAAMWSNAGFAELRRAKRSDFPPYGVDRSGLFITHSSPPPTRSGWIAEGRRVGRASCLSFYITVCLV